jgi:DnaK suppressor protein
VSTATKSKSAKSAAVKTAAVKPVTTVTMPPAAEVAKKSPRAAKAMAMMPPPPGQSVASTTAKSSYGPISVPSLPAVVPVIPVKDPKLANNWKSKTAETISEAEVMAMSDDVYMNAFQLAYFRHKLVQLKNDILVNAGETTEHLREDTVIVPDPADRATIEEEHALELRTRDRERKLLKKIEQSITRIDSGDYGYCDETGEPIGVGRLIARPTATLSLEAQQRRELKQKMFGD